MRKILLLGVLLFMAAPAMASSVTLSCVVDDNMVTVSYNGGSDHVRAFGLDITLTGDSTITKMEMVSTDYRIFPGQIVIDNGVVTDYGTPYAADDLGDANLAVEMGSLYAADDPCKQTAPPTSGQLFKFWVKPCVSGEGVTASITENTVRGGVVMEDPDDDPDVTLCTDVVICEAEEACIVPDVRGLSESAAETALIAAGLVKGAVTQECNDIVTNGLVLRSDPVQDTEVECGSAVALVKSLNPPMPGAASNPTPAAGTLNVSITQDLSWTVGADTATQDIYFGKTNPPPQVAAGVPASTTTYDTGTMTVYSLYYWRIDELSVGASPPCKKRTGTVWCFVTGPTAAVMARSCLLEATYPKCLGDIKTTAPYKPPPGDNTVRSTDLTALLNFVNITLAPNVPANRCTTVLGSGDCPTCYDINGDGSVRSTDVTALLNLINSWAGRVPANRHTCPYPSCANP